MGLSLIVLNIRYVTCILHSNQQLDGVFNLNRPSLRYVFDFIASLQHLGMHVDASRGAFSGHILFRFFVVRTMCLFLTIFIFFAFVIPLWLSHRKFFSAVCVCVCVFSSHSFWTSSSLDVPAGVTQEKGHTGISIYVPSAVHAFIFLARRIQPFLSLVDREVEFCVLTI